MNSPSLGRHPPGLVSEGVVMWGALALGLLSGVLVASLEEASFLHFTRFAALGAAIALAVHGVRQRILTSPLMLLGIPLTLSLAAATLPITRIFSDWSSSSLTAAIAIVAAPVVGVAAAVFATDRRIPAPGPDTPAVPYAGRLVLACSLMTVVGTVVYLIEFATIGGPPILSSNIDEARFSLEYGPLHLLTQGVPLAFLIATWARVARPQHFSGVQLRLLEVNMVFAPLVLALVGGRSLVLLALIAGLVVSARYLSRSAARRLMVIVPVAVLAFSSAVFLLRAEQNASLGPFQAVLYDSSTGERAELWDSAYRTLSLNLGEQLRVVTELREANITSPPFTTSLWFAHNLTERAVDPHQITLVHAGGWLTSTYAGQVLLDFGLGVALLYGVLFGALAHLLYRRFAEGRSVTIIWVYAYLAGPIFMAFYLNIFLYFLFPILDVVGLIVLSRVLVESPGLAGAGVSRLT